MPGFSGGVGSSVGGAAGDNGSNSGGGVTHSWNPNKVNQVEGYAGQSASGIRGGWDTHTSGGNAGGGNGGALGGGGNGGGANAGAPSAPAIDTSDANLARLQGIVNQNAALAASKQSGQRITAARNAYNAAQQQIQQINQARQQQAQQQQQPGAPAAQPDYAAQQAAQQQQQQQAAQQAAQQAQQAEQQRQQEAAAEAARQAAAEAERQRVEMERQRTVAQGEESARSSRAQLLTEQLRLNQQRAAQDVSPYRRQAAQSAINAIGTELQALTNQSVSYMKQWQPDTYKTVEQIQQGGMVTAANGTPVAGETSGSNDAMAFADAQHPSVLGVLGAMGKGFVKGFLSGGPVGGLASMVVEGVGASGAFANGSLRGQNPNVNGVTSEGYGPGQTLANGQRVGQGNEGGSSNSGTSGWRPASQGQVNPLAPGYDASGAGAGAPAGSAWTVGANQANEQAYNQYLGLLAQREKDNSLTTNAGWLGGSGTSLLGRWAATVGGRGGASGTEYSPLSTGPKSLYG